MCCPKCKEVIKEGTYHPDFTFKHPTNQTKRLLVETKGRFTSIDRSKMIAVKKANPTEDIRIVLQRDNKLSTSSKTRYSEWCAKNSYPFFIGEIIPDEWIKEFMQSE